MLRIKTLTCHHVYNHGSSLQAYALQRFLTSLGHEVKIIDYRPSYLDQRSNFFCISPTWAARGVLARMVYLGSKVLPRLRWRLQSNCKPEFDEFTSLHLRLTTKRYGSIDSLRESSPAADLYLAGSDQIWNTLYWNGRDPAFFLDFGAEETIRASYAASFGTDTLVPECVDFVRDKLVRLDAISVRETHGITILEGLGIKGSQHVLDPVFLLEAEDWEAVVDHSININERYLLVYDFENSAEFRHLAQRLAGTLGVKIYSVNNYCRTHYADRDFFEVGPPRFLSLIQNAELVVSNSFHATAFSIIFGKEFLVIGRQKDKVNSRMESLLRSAGMSERMVGTDSKVEDVVSIGKRPIRSSNELQVLIQESKSYLFDLLDLVVAKKVV